MDSKISEFERIAADLTARYPEEMSFLELGPKLQAAYAKVLKPECTPARLAELGDETGARHREHGGTSQSSLCLAPKSRRNPWGMVSFRGARRQRGLRRSKFLGFGSVRNRADGKEEGNHGG